MDNITTTTNTQSLLNYQYVVDEILNVLTDYGFMTEIPFDETELKQKIVEIIQKKVEGKNE